MSLKNYTLKYLLAVLLIIIAVWAGLFYAVILEELYDNTDDGLKDLKIQIIRKAYIDENILTFNEFDFNQFRINRIDASQYKEGTFFRNEKFYMEYDEEMEPYRILETYFIDKTGNHQKLEIRTSTVEEDDFREDLLFALLFLYVFLVVSIILVNNIVLKKVWRPFYKTLANLESYEFGKPNESEKNATPIREFKLLNEKIDKMTERNEATFAQQKQFIENAAHELQTPLAIAINKLDLLIETQDFSEENLVALSQTKDGLLRLVKLNKSLLVLSRIENNQFWEKQEIVLNEIVKTVLEDFSDAIEFKNIAVDFAENGNFTTKLNADLVYILISNLVRNAITHNQLNGKIIIHITHNLLQIKNTPFENNLLDKNLIFNRFYKSNHDKASTGLGLSIVKTIIDNHSDLDIDYTFEENLHIFSVKAENS